MNIFAKHIKKIAAFVGLLVILGIIAAAVFHFRGKQPSQMAMVDNVNNVAVPDTNQDQFIVPETQSATEGLRSYQNSAFHFGLLYPQEMQVREYKESGNAMSAIFADATNGRGFQIYVTPYQQDQITKERFQLDEPSGLMKEPTDILVDGVQATMFLSKNSIMGETREVWFIKNGFLYEVVTYKQLDDWLAGIMQTWKFI